MYDPVYQIFFAAYKLYYWCLGFFYSRRITANVGGKAITLSQIHCNYYGHDVNIAGLRFRETFLPVKEIFFQKEYDYLNVKGRQVVDIGGFNGDSAISFAIRGARKVYVYEANPVLIPLIKYNLKENGVSQKVEVFKNLVSRNAGKSSNVYTDDQNMVSLSKQHIVGKLKESIPKVTLNKIVANNRIKNGALKMDVEGAEYEIIESTSIPALQRFRQIQVDFHKNGSETLVKKLSKAGFRCNVTMTIDAGKVKSGYISAERG